MTSSTGSTHELFEARSTVPTRARRRVSIGALIGGAAMIAGSAYGIVWNESRTGQFIRGFAEGKQAVVSADLTTVDPAHAGKLVHVSGMLTATKTLRDPDLGIEFAGLQLERRVEIYQWVENSRTVVQKSILGRDETTTVYSYSKAWRTSHVDSSRFHTSFGHHNPQPTVRKQTFVANGATLGAYTLGRHIVGQTGGFSAVRVDAGSLEAARAKLGDRVVVEDGKILVSATPTYPRVGDMRISFHGVSNATYSVIGRQTGYDLTAAQTSSGNTMLLVQRGTSSAAAMIGSAERSKMTLTWALRCIMGVLMLLGLALLIPRSTGVATPAQ